MGGDWRRQIGRLELDLVELVSGEGEVRGECVCVWGGGLEAADRPARAGPGGVVSGGGRSEGSGGGGLEGADRPARAGPGGVVSGGGGSGGDS